ncbi:MAG TPA: MBOAT family O-acyltransferase [Bryobacteraceae bacterium]|nr:MBOAT family O-acyltransferase [Bryobacteraceae bacterium]
MFFDTPVYFCFLITVVLVYWRLGRFRQNLLLLAASYFFYAWWDWRFLSLIVTSSVVDFFAARYIAQSPNKARRRALLSLSLVLNFGFLGFFKYFNFFADSFAVALTAMGVPTHTVTLLRIVLPPGISFYTFQAVAYIVDVYYGKLKPADSLVDYALFIGLFPHLVAGPIQRPSHLLPQVQKTRVFDGERFSDGVMLILAGLFRKCVVADNCALLADAAFSGRMGTPDLGVVLIGMYAFAWQIYADFSGYSDIARGSAQLMGFHFMVNFRQPYLAVNLRDFWRRWHISLSTWLRDYLYIPLGGNRRGEAKTYRNLMLTMLLGGLWHGANWTFVVWGGIHGMGLALERWLGGGGRGDDEPARSTLSTWVHRVVLFHIVGLAWIFFRSQSLSDAVNFLGGVGVLHLGSQFLPALEFLATFTLPLFFMDLMLEMRSEEYIFQNLPNLQRVAVGAALTFLLLVFAANTSAAFIYFQF